MNEMIQSITAVNVIAEFTTEGKVVPLAVRWKNGTVYMIEKITYQNDFLRIRQQMVY